MTALMLLCSAAAPAQEKITADTGAELVSGYIWRGQELGHVRLQPALTIGYQGFTLSGWGSVGFEKDDPRAFDRTRGSAGKGFHVAVTD